MKPLACLILVVLLATPTRAQDVNLSSPKDAAKSLYRAVERGDEAAIRRTFYATTDAERELAGAYATMIVATKRLADVAQKKYGGAADAFAQGAVTEDDVKKIDAAEVKPQGPDRATIALPLAPRPISLRRGEGGWQIVISDFAGGAPERINAQIAMTREIATVATEVADAIDSDKYPTAQEAEQAVQQRMNEVMTKAVRANPPTTAATQPATQPG